MTDDASPKFSQTSSVFGRTPPGSLEAEHAVLAAIVAEPESVARALEVLRDGDFYWERHRRIYRAMAAIWERGERVDPVTLGERLRQTGELEAVGGWDALSTLVGSAPTARNLEQHARIVREKALLRRVVESASDVIRAAHDSRDTALAEVGAAAQRLAAQLDAVDPSGGFRWVKEYLWATFEAIDRRAGGSSTGVPTGYPRVDAMTDGFHPGDLVVLAARPSMGKTALLLNVLANVARAGTPCAVVSLEQAGTELTTRLLAAEARLDFQKLRRGRLAQDEHEKLAAAASTLNQMKLYIDDHPQTRIGELTAKITRLRQTEGVEVVGVDYIGLMEGSGEENRRLEIGAITRGLKLVAKRLGIRVVALSQLSRGPESRANHRPLLSDLRESGDIEQDADLVLFLYRPEVYVQDGDTEKAREKAEAERARLAGRAELIVAKQRNGPTGTVPLYFHRTYMRFDPLDTHTP